MRKEIIAITVLICLALTSIEPVFASTIDCLTSTSPTCAVYGPFTAVGAPSKSYSSFNAPFIQLKDASVSFDGTTYTFTITLSSSMDSTWMTSSWQPTWSAPNQKVHVTYVGYHISFSDQNGNFLAFIYAGWNPTDGFHFGAIRCNRLTTYNGCIHEVGQGVGVGNYHWTPSSMTASVDPNTSTVTLIISQTDLNGINTMFTTQPANWLAVAWAGQQSSKSSEGGAGYLTYPHLPIPTTP